MITGPSVKGERIAVLGLGRSGIATCLALQAGGADVLAWDEATHALKKARRLNLPLVDLSQSQNLSGCDRLVLSPGIPHLYPAPNPIVQEALSRGIILDNDIGLFFEFFRHYKATREGGSCPTVIAVTGTNGKSTTTALINHVLIRAGFRSEVAGNIGNAVLGISPLEKNQFIVLEVSSYQLDLARTLEPDIAIFLNFCPDHLGRHGGLGGYFCAKSRLFRGQDLQLAIVGTDETEGRFLANQLENRQARPIVFRLTQENMKANLSHAIIARNQALIEIRNGQTAGRHVLDGVQSLSGNHNLQNAGAALVACRHVGIPTDVIVKGFKQFKGLPHRSQFIARINGVNYINDSKATNHASAAKALQSFPNIHWLAGGLAKEDNFDGLEQAAANVKKAYFFGHAAKNFALGLGAVKHDVFKTLPEALNEARQEAKPGDTILLAPAAASFDQYDDFEQRGNHFIHEVIGDRSGSCDNVLSEGDLP